MVEVIADIVIPRELVIPDATAVRGMSGNMTISGALLFISGNLLWMNQNSVFTQFSGAHLFPT